MVGKVGIPLGSASQVAVTELRHTSGPKRTSYNAREDVPFPRSWPKGYVTNDRIRVLLADDHAVVRKGIRQCLQWDKTNEKHPPLRVLSLKRRVFWPLVGLRLGAKDSNLYIRIQSPLSYR